MFHWNEDTGIAATRRVWVLIFVIAFMMICFSAAFVIDLAGLV